MKRKKGSPDYAQMAAQYIQEHMNGSELPVLTEAEIKIVAKRIHEKLKAKFLPSDETL